MLLACLPAVQNRLAHYFMICMVTNPCLQVSQPGADVPSVLQNLPPSLLQDALRLGVAGSAPSGGSRSGGGGGSRSGGGRRSVGPRRGLLTSGGGGTLGGAVSRLGWFCVPQLCICVAAASSQLQLTGH